jgi:hypothetical protein
MSNKEFLTWCAEQLPNLPHIQTRLRLIAEQCEAQENEAAAALVNSKPAVQDSQVASGEEKK